MKRGLGGWDEFTEPKQAPQLLLSLGFVVQGVKEDGGNWWKTYRLRAPTGYLEVEFLHRGGPDYVRFTIVEAHQSGAPPSTMDPFIVEGFDFRTMDEFKETLSSMLVRFDSFQETVGPRVLLPRGLLDSYLDAALWSSTDEYGEPLDRAYDRGDFSEEALNSARVDLETFLARADDALNGAYSSTRAWTFADIGHDFWLTRNRHGAGFGDRLQLYGEHSALMLEAFAQEFNEVHPYANDSGVLEFA